MVRTAWIRRYIDTPWETKLRRWVKEKVGQRGKRTARKENLIIPFKISANAVEKPVQSSGKGAWTTGSIRKHVTLNKHARRKNRLEERHESTRYTGCTCVTRSEQIKRESAFFTIKSSDGRAQQRQPVVTYYCNEQSIGYHTSKQVQ